MIYWMKKLTKMSLPMISLYKTILILPHTMPDGDTIGSSVALAHGLRQLGKDAYIVLDDALPNDIAFLTHEIMSVSEFESMNLKVDLCITVDLSDLERLSQRKSLISNLPLWNIDHHITNLMFGDVKFVDFNASATGEVVFSLLKEWGVVFNQTIAEALYVAIATDTGSFKYSTTTPRTHRITAELLEIGIRRDYLALNLYHSEPFTKLKLHALALAQLYIYSNGKVARAVVTKDMLNESGARLTEADGLVERIRDIAGIEAVILLKEVGTGEIKVSMRSIGDLDVSTPALNHGGGGHKNAAGFSIFDSLSVAVDIVNRLAESLIC
jgi:phosphoesterase RecJ-like protein